ncbi:MAG: 2Fe-2S iron-sulfur cluster-binding protein [Bacteroidota bacterium]
MPKVHFIPLGKSKEIKPGATILAAATQLGVPIGQSCSGDGVCGWCRVKVVRGHEHLSPLTALEKKLAQACGFKSDERAACLAHVQGEVAVTTAYW